jgi:hypothetical protein
MSADIIHPKRGIIVENPGEHLTVVFRIMTCEDGGASKIFTLKCVIKKVTLMLHSRRGHVSSINTLIDDVIRGSTVLAFKVGVMM